MYLFRLFSLLSMITLSTMGMENTQKSASNPYAHLLHQELIDKAYDNPIARQELYSRAFKGRIMEPLTVDCDRLFPGYRDNEPNLSSADIFVLLCLFRGSDFPSTIFKLEMTRDNFAITQNNLGYMYENGVGVTENYTQAFKYYTLAANQELAPAQYNLGSMYEYGRGVTQDYTKAFQYYTLAANQGLAETQNSLGDMYHFGQGVTKNYTQAFQYYTLAANQGYAVAQNNLGDMYKNGHGVKKDYTQAFQYYTLAANQGYAVAQNNLGDMYKNGDGLIKDYNAAFRHYTLAANQGDLTAHCNLGDMYKNGHGITKDYDIAFQYYTFAANQGYAAAQYNLGAMYHRGLGVTQDDAIAFQHFTLAANQGYAAAQNNLGAMYHRGLGVARNNAKAVLHYTRAAKREDATAQSNLKSLSLNAYFRFQIIQALKGDKTRYAEIKQYLLPQVHSATSRRNKNLSATSYQNKNLLEDLHIACGYFLRLEIQFSGEDAGNYSTNSLLFSKDENLGRHAQILSKILNHIIRTLDSLRKPGNGITCINPAAIKEGDLLSPLTVASPSKTRYFFINKPLQKTFSNLGKYISEIMKHISMFEKEVQNKKRLLLSNKPHGIKKQEIDEYENLLFLVQTESETSPKICFEDIKYFLWDLEKDIWNHLRGGLKERNHLFLKTLGDLYKGQFPLDDFSQLLYSYDNCNIM